MELGFNRVFLRNHSSSKTHMCIFIYLFLFGALFAGQNHWSLTSKTVYMTVGWVLVKTQYLAKRLEFGRDRGQG